jgi:hypothetical protein
MLPSPGIPVTWFLDIDGVVNIIGPRPRGGWPRYANTVIPQGVNGLAWPVCYAPGLVELLNVLHQRKIVSFRWLTTWEYDGPKIFAPAVGLDLGSWVAAEDIGSSATWWKLDAIVDHLAGDDSGLFIWTDDDIKHFMQARQIVDMLDPQRALVICPDERKGLTPENFTAILTAIEEVAWT